MKIKMIENEIKIRFANRDDLQAIVNIYNQAIKSRSATGDLDEFNVDERYKWFENFNNNEYPLYVAEIKDRVVGYCTVSPYRPGRKAMSTVAEISYYLDYSFHGKGIGTELLKHVIADCNRIGKKNLLAILLDINLPSIGLLEKLNFKKWGHFPEIISIDGEKCGHLVYGLKIKQN